jgi:transposase
MVRAAMAGIQGGRANRQPPTVAWLRQRVAVVEAERQQVRAERDRLAGEVERLTDENQRLKARVRELVARVEALRRAGKRQAAPFSNDQPTPTPDGRAASPAWQHARRPVPDRVDRVVAVGLGSVCPSCGGELAVERVASQWQEDLPPPAQTEICRYEVQIGRCRTCRRRVQPRHPDQTSDALGAAAVQLGPRAVALAAWCSKGLGLPAGKVARLLGQLGRKVTPGGVGQAIARAARRAAPTDAALVEGVRHRPVVASDETGWRVAGRRAWLWAFAGQGVIVYRIAQGRGYDDATAVLGEGFTGVLERDGWAPYRRFTRAVHQTCLAHLLRRVGELLGDAKRGQAKTPHAVRRILQQALAIRDQRDAGELTVAQAAEEAGRLGAAVDKLLAGRTEYAPNRRLRAQLGRERDALCTFLGQPGVQATNWRAEHAIRPAVVCRKTWGGNATWDGAATWQVLSSVLATARQQQRDPVALLVGLLRAPGPVVADLAIPGLARAREPGPARHPPAGALPRDRRRGRRRHRHRGDGCHRGGVPRCRRRPGRRPPARRARHRRPTPSVGAPRPTHRRPSHRPPPPNPVTHYKLPCLPQTGRWMAAFGGRHRR